LQTDFSLVVTDPAVYDLGNYNFWEIIISFEILVDITKMEYAHYVV